MVELMIASVLSLIVFAALFSAYIFMGRNLARIANFQQQQTQNRRALFVVAKDVDEAVQVSAPLPASLILTLPPRPPSPDITTITYTYDSSAHTFTRVAVTGTSSSTTILLNNLTSFVFAYFDESGGAAPPQVFIKQIQFSYSSAVGDRPNGTQAGDSLVSSRMVLRSKPPLGQ